MKFKFIGTAWLAGAIVATQPSCSKSADPVPAADGSGALAAKNESTGPKALTGSGSGDSLVAQTNARAAQAAKLNEKGKDLVFAGKFEDAASTFRDAIALVDDPLYYFNLATALYQAGRFTESLVSVKAVLGANPSPKLVEKTLRLRDKVLAECTAQGMECSAEANAQQASRLYEQGIEIDDAEQVRGCSAAIQERDRIGPAGEVPLRPRDCSVAVRQAPRGTHQP